MNQRELIKAIAKISNKKDGETTKFVAAFCQVIRENISDEVRVAGLGTFSSKVRVARKGTNPKTREVIDIPAKWAPVFKPSSALKDASILHNTDKEK
jgi:DNA-binding protein HU-beta